MISGPTTPAQRYALLTLPLLVALVYVFAFPGHFFMDDAQIVKANNLVYQLDLKAIFTADYWGPGHDSGLFRPLTILSFALNRLLFGVEPWGYLLVNILLHLTVTILLYVFLTQIGLAWESAWLAAVIFAVHPIHGEPIIQLVGRSELLAALFSLLALLSSRKAGIKAEVTTAGCFVLALLSKESGIVVLALIPLCDYFFDRDLRGLISKRYRLYLTLLLLVAGWLAYRNLVVHPDSGGHLVYTPQYVPLAFVDTGTRILAAFKLQALYAVNFLWPFQLQGMYPASTVAPAPPWLSLQGFVAGSAFLLLVCAAAVGWKRKQLWALLICFYLVSFTPTANLFFAAGFTMADRVAYAPSDWFLALLAILLLSVPVVRRRRFVKLTVMVVLVGYFTLAGCVHTRHFATPEALWQHDLRLNPRNELSRMLLASELLRQHRLAEAEEQLKTLIAIAPDFDEALSAYARILILTNRPEEGRAMAMRAIGTLKEGMSLAKIPLSLALTSLGRPAEALQSLQVLRPSDRLGPGYWEAYGKALEAQGDLVGALTCYQNELSANGERAADAFRRLGSLALRFGKFADAEAALRRDVQINPQSAAGWNLLGVVLARQGSVAEAEPAFLRAVTLDSTMREYQDNLDRVRRGKR
jgi:protein O-mannosyl-transferase